jgi:hypothetical protein
MAALACWFLAALALFGCSAATPARTAYFATAGADIGTTVYALHNGYKELNPAGIWGALALKAGVFLIAERFPEPWRSRLYWFSAGVNLSAATYNVVVLSQPTKVQTCP